VKLDGGSFDVRSAAGDGAGTIRSMSRKFFSRFVSVCNQSNMRYCAVLTWLPATAGVQMKCVENEMTNELSARRTLCV
jgi:hypothetical protein